MSLTEVLTIAAIVIGPIVAVSITLGYDTYRDRRSRRMELFRTLMRTRRTPILPEHVGALNLIEIEFAKDDAVIKRWTELLTHFGTHHNRREEEAKTDDLRDDELAARDAKFYGRLSDERQRLLAKLLHAMARVLDFRAEQLEIFEGGYTPQGWVDIEAENASVRRLFAQIGDAKRTFPIGVFNFTNMQQPQGAVREKRPGRK